MLISVIIWEIETGALNLGHLVNFQYLLGPAQKHGFTVDSMKVLMFPS